MPPAGCFEQPNRKFMGYVLGLLLVRRIATMDNLSAEELDAQ